MKRNKWTLKLLLKRLKVVFQTQGIRGLWFGIMGEMFYRRLVLFNRSLDMPVELAVPQIPINIRILDLEHVNDYIHFRPDESLSEIECYLNIGHRCYVAYYKQQIVSACWVATGNVWIDYLFFNITISSSDIYLYNVYTAPSYRTKNIASAIITMLIKNYVNSNYKNIILTVLPEYKGVIQIYKKLNFNPFGLIGFIKVGPWKNAFCRLFSKPLQKNVSCPNIVLDR